MNEKFREEIEDLLNEGKFEQICSTLHHIFDKESSINIYNFANKIFKKISSELKFPTVKIAILRSITLEQIVPFLTVKCFLNNLQPEINLGGYNLIDQEILNPQSELYNFDPEILVIFSRAEEWCPRLLDDFISLTMDNIQAEIDDVL